MDYLDVPNTPFTAARTPDGWYLLMGEYKLSEKAYNTYDELIEDELNKNKWHTVGKYVFAVVDFMKKNTK